MPASTPPAKKSKRWLIWLIAVLVLLGAMAASYFFITPVKAFVNKTFGIGSSTTTSMADENDDEGFFDDENAEGDDFGDEDDEWGEDDWADDDSSSEETTDEEDLSSNEEEAEPVKPQKENQVQNNTAQNTNQNKPDRTQNTNNTNNNTNATYNAWKNYTNRQPSKENNLLLTDDVEIDVWQLNNKAAVPVRGIANDVTMKINQKSKMLNFAFVSGPLNLAMPNYKANDLVTPTNTNSYQTWARSYDFCKSATLALDDGGNAYGTIAGGDTGDYYADAFGFYSSKWGTGNLTNDHGTQTGKNQNGIPHKQTIHGVLYLPPPAIARRQKGPCILPVSSRRQGFSPSLKPVAKDR